MHDLGNMTPGGFRPGEPSIENILSRLGVNMDGDGSETMKIEPSEQQRENDELLRAYARFASTSDGEKILEDLLNMTLRASSRPDGGYETIEATAMAAVKHQSRSDLVCSICAKIVKGRSLPAPNSQSSK